MFHQLNPRLRARLRTVGEAGKLHERILELERESAARLACIREVEEVLRQCDEERVSKTSRVAELEAALHEGRIHLEVVEADRIDKTTRVAELEAELQKSTSAAEEAIAELRRVLSAIDAERRSWLEVRGRVRLRLPEEWRQRIEAARDALSRSPSRDPIPFGGWNCVTGLDAPEGPYPAENLPVVRWGLWPKTTLDVSTAGERAVTLVIGARTSSAQSVSVFLNEQKIGARALSPNGRPQRSHRLHFRMTLRAGDNTIELRYGRRLKTEDARPLALLYDGLSITGV